MSRRVLTVYDFKKEKFITFVVDSLLRLWLKSYYVCGWKSYYVCGYYVCGWRFYYVCGWFLFSKVESLWTIFFLKKCSQVVLYALRLKKLRKSQRKKFITFVVDSLLRLWLFITFVVVITFVGTTRVDHLKIREQ